MGGPAAVYGINSEMVDAISVRVARRMMVFDEDARPRAAD
jgi:hypothetical protein